MLKVLRTVVLVAMAVSLGIFVVQNLATTEIAFLGWSIIAPRGLAFLLVFSLGLIFGYLIRTLHWEPFQRAKPQKNFGDPQPVQPPAERRESQSAS